MGASMDLKRRIAGVAAVAAIALGAGHLVQNLSAGKAPAARPSAQLQEKPKAVQTVAAGPEATAPAPAATPDPALATVAPSAPAPLPAPASAPLLTEAPAAEAPPPALPAAPALSEAPVVPNCTATLDLVPEQHAMIGVTLLARCHENERVILQHAGLAVTAMTTASGALFTGLPGLEAEATVTAVFLDGTRVEAQIALPELAALRRFGVQWQGEDAFQLHAFEGGATYGQPGDLSAANPRMPSEGLKPGQGFITLLGDPTAPSPLLAEVYTFPADPAAKADVVVEAGVNKATCGREILGETLASLGGKSTVTELTVAMPECDAVGDYLVLKNLAPQMNIAAAN
ncbi:hypothetical protein MASR2M74_20110 [Paracoccaceae bacterium]